MNFFYNQSKFKKSYSCCCCCFLCSFFFVFSWEGVIRVSENPKKIFFFFSFF